MLSCDAGIALAAKARLNFTLTASIPTAQGHAIGHIRVPRLLWGLWSPGAVPACAPVIHLTCESQVLRCTEGRAPHPVVPVPVLIPTRVRSLTSQGDIPQHDVAELPMLGFHAVLLHPILAEDDSGSGRMPVDGAAKQKQFPVPSAEGVQEEIRSWEVTWRDGTRMAQVSITGVSSPGVHTWATNPCSGPISTPTDLPCLAHPCAHQYLENCRCPGWPR